jgi:general secretion pathway protein B
MSFILDALRKSELERQRQSGPSIAELPIAREDHRMPWVLLAIGVLLAINAGGLLYFMLRADKPAVPAVETRAPIAAAPAATAPAAAPAAAAPLPVPAELPAATDTMPADEAPPIVPGPSEASSPPPAPDPTLLPDASVTYAPAPAADHPPSIDEMPAQATAGLPELSVDLHIYTDDPAKRAVFINGRRYQKGAVLAEGPTVEEITREGVVLSYRGQRFQLPRQ